MNWKKSSLYGLVIGIILAVIIDVLFPTSWFHSKVGGWSVKGWMHFLVPHIIFIVIVILLTNLIICIISKIKSKKK